jgi:ribosomal protein S18 acetylase RimI-like enzyme
MVKNKKEIEISPDELKQLETESKDEQTIEYSIIKKSNLNNIDDLQELYPKWKRLGIIKKLKETIEGKNERFVARKNGKIIGHVKVEMKKGIHKHVAEISSLIVLSRERGQGIGLGLVKYAISKLPKKIKLVRLEVDMKNKAAIQLYKKIGFKEYGKLKKASHIDGKFVDNLLMAKYL